MKQIEDLITIVRERRSFYIFSIFLSSHSFSSVSPFSSLPSLFPSSPNIYTPITSLYQLYFLPSLSPSHLSFPSHPIPSLFPSIPFTHLPPAVTPQFTPHFPTLLPLPSPHASSPLLLRLSSTLISIISLTRLFFSPFHSPPLSTFFFYSSPSFFIISLFSLISILFNSTLLFLLLSLSSLLFLLLYFFQFSSVLYVRNLIKEKQ